MNSVPVQLAGFLGAGPSGSEAEVHGLGVADSGLRVVVEQPELRRGRPQTVAFRIVGADGEPARDFDVTHEKRILRFTITRDGEPVRTEPYLGYRLFLQFKHHGEIQTVAFTQAVAG